MGTPTADTPLTGDQIANAILNTTLYDVKTRSTPKGEWTILNLRLDRATALAAADACERLLMSQGNPLAVALVIPAEESASHVVHLVETPQKA